MKFFITNHCKERYLQRFGDESYQHLDYCKDKPCEICKRLKEEVKIAIKNYQFESMLHEKLKHATETKIHHNNFNFMESMYEKYGYESRFRFLVNGEVLFICRDTNVVVTCFHVMSSILKNFVSRPKYSNKYKKKFQ